MKSQEETTGTKILLRDKRGKRRWRRRQLKAELEKESND